MCTAVITRISDGRIAVSSIVGKFLDVAVDGVNAYLKVGTYERATLLIDCQSDVFVETYKSPS